MSDVISSLLIQIKADATSALVAFKNVATGTTQVTQTAAAAAPALAAVNQQVAQAGEVAQRASGHIAGMSYYFRSFFDSMRFAMLGNPMAAFYMVDEATRAMVASGLGLMPIAGIIGSIGAAIGGSFLVWEEFGDHMDADAEKAKKLADALDKIPDAVKRAFEAQKLGAITEEERKQYEAILSGQTPTYVGPNSSAKSLNLLPVPLLNRPKGAFNPLAQAAPGQSGMFGIMNPVQAYLGPIATAQQHLDYVYQQIDKKMAENQKAVAAAEVAQADAAEQTKLNKPAAESAKQQEATLDRLRKRREEELKQLDEQAVKQAQADKQHEAELQRQAQLTRDIQRSAIENQIESVKSNALMTDQQKLQVVSALQAEQEQINNAEISELETLKTQVKSVSDQLELEKKIAELKSQNQKLSEANTPEKQNSFAYQWTAMLASQSDKWTGWAQESADSFAKAWDGATNSVSGGLTHLFEYGAQKGQWFREIWNGVIGSMISNVTHLAVEWVAQHVIMTGIHAVAEQAMTGATAAGATERSAVRLAETVMHNTLVALRLAAHIAGEVAATAITAVQAMARAIYHAIAAAIGAMESEASVPYVGVILGIAAAAAVMAAAYGMMGGFAEGGYTGDGHPSQVAGIVHAGEYVIPANRVNSSTMPLLHALRSGALADAAAPHGAGALTPPTGPTGSQAGGAVQINTSHYIFTDKAKMARAIEQDDAHQKWVVDTVAQSAYKFR